MRGILLKDNEKRPKENKGNSTDIEENQKIKQKQIKSIENNRERSINRSEEQEKSKKKIKEIKRKITQKRVSVRNALKNYKIYYQNVRGLNSKLDSLQQIIDDYQLSLVCIVETRMQKEKEIQVPGYHCAKYRNFTKFSGVETVPFLKIPTPRHWVKLRYLTQCI